MLNTIGLIAILYLAWKFTPRPKLNIVQFNKEKYAIQWSLGPYKAYKDLKHACWWSQDAMFFKDCLGTLEECENHFTWENRNSPIKIVK